MVQRACERQVHGGRARGLNEYRRRRLDGGAVAGGGGGLVGWVAGGETGQLSLVAPGGNAMRSSLVYACSLWTRVEQHPFSTGSEGPGISLEV